MIKQLFRGKCICVLTQSSFSLIKKEEENIAYACSVFLIIIYWRILVGLVKDIFSFEVTWPLCYKIVYQYIRIPDVSISAGRYRFWEMCYESCLPHICTAFRNFCITLINRSQVFPAIFNLSFITHNFALVFDVTIAKNNILRINCCGFIIVNRRRSEGEIIILSLHLYLVMFQYTQ
jgi:hypothetical protein